MLARLSLIHFLNISGAKAPASLKRAHQQRGKEMTVEYLRGKSPGLIEACSVGFASISNPPNISGAKAPASLKLCAPQHPLVG